ncbi:DUF1799 domain-containing protein [Marivivens aquimaris]|uniref:DUF1799 domain-containing protein n=1 Tax=Marivivens aquimaris TaxID=2774876 RepID=UPI003899372C
MLGVTLSAPIAEDSFEVWGCHLPALNAFLAIATQWAFRPSGHVASLDYSRVEAGLRLAGIEVTPDQWSDVQVIEAGATEALHA